MSGFLDKKSRLLDYKLTEDGRSQLSSGDIRFKYYTFSDRSIVYQSKTAVDGQKISDSEIYYLPFEVTTDPGLQTNPEYFLSSKLTYDNPVTSFFSVNQAQRLTVENLTSRKFLIDKTLTNSKGIFETNFVFDELTTKTNFDFYDRIVSRKYPTVKVLNESIENIADIKNDQRFDEILKFKKMAPINQDGTSLIENSIELEDNKTSIFKSFDVKNTISETDSRSEVISKTISILEKESSKKFHYLRYVLDSSTLKSDDVFHFEMHEVIAGSLKKLPFVNLGKIFDKSRNRFINVFLVGKFIIDRNLEEKFNIENRTGGRKSIVNYKFVNMFTVVVE